MSYEELAPLSAHYVRHFYTSRAQAPFRRGKLSVSMLAKIQAVLENSIAACIFYRILKLTLVVTETVPPVGFG